VTQTRVAVEWVPSYATMMHQVRAFTAAMSDMADAIERVGTAWDALVAAHGECEVMTDPDPCGSELEWMEHSIAEAHATYDPATGHGTLRNSAAQERLARAAGIDTGHQNRDA